MKCSNCGRSLTGEENFCRICGNRIEKEIENIDESFTGDIDVTEVQISTKPFDTELNTKTNNNFDELDAMMEISNSFLKKEKEFSESVNDNNKLFDFRLDEDRNSDFIQSTQDLLLNNDNSYDNDDLLLNEPTMLVPSELINNYSKNIFDNSDIIEDISKEYNSNELINDTQEEFDKNNFENIESEKEEAKIDIQVSDLNTNIVSVTPDENVIDDTGEKVKIVYKNKKNPFTILLAVFFIISLFSIGYLTYLLLSSYNIIQSVNNSNIKLEDEISDLKEKNNDFQFELNNKMNQTSAKTFKYNNFLLKVLDNYEYSIDNNTLIIKNDKISLDINFDNTINYSKIRENIDEYSKILTGKGYIVSSYGIKVEAEREYAFYLVTSNDEKNSLIVYSMIDENNTIGILINSDNIKNNYEDLKITNSIIESISIDNTYIEKDVSLFNEKNVKIDVNPKVETSIKNQG